MSDTSPAKAMASSGPASRTYSFRPLTGSAVRLIRILEDDPEQDLIRCVLLHMPLSVNPPPSYLAISYTWGNADAKKKRILIDGIGFFIPANLYHALRYIRRIERVDSTKGVGPWLPEQTLIFARRPWLLWADAICINQLDEAEKAAQIPRMMGIFGSAQEVIGWLDHRLPPGVTWDSLNDVLEKGKGLRNKYGDDWLKLWLGSEKNLKQSLGVDEAGLDRMSDIIFQIASCAWFKRLWVIQENAVSRNRPVALVLAGHVFDALDFYSLVNLFAERPKWFLMPTSLSCSVAMFRTRNRHEIHTGVVEPDSFVAMPQTDDQLVLFAWRLHALLVQTGTAPFTSTIKHDMVYGILSMSMPPDPMPPELTIEYSLDWVEVCRRYARFIAEKTGAISFLVRLRHAEALHRASSGRTEYIPSWVPDLGTASLLNLVHFYSHVERARFEGSRVTFSEDGCEMTVDGISLGKPVALTRRSDLVQKTRNYYDGNGPVYFDRQDALEFVDQILKPAAAQRNSSLDEVLKCWINCWEHSIDRGFKDSEEPKIRRTFKRWIRGAGPGKLNLDVTKIQGRAFSTRSLIVSRRLNSKSRLKNWVVTADGRGWLTLFQDEVKPDDVIVVLRGLEENPAVLRRTCRGEENVVECGDKYRLMGLLIERVPLIESAWEDDISRHLADEKRFYPDDAWSKFTLV